MDDEEFWARIEVLSAPTRNRIEDAYAQSIAAGDAVVDKMAAEEPFRNLTLLQSCFRDSWRLHGRTDPGVVARRAAASQIATPPRPLAPPGPQQFVDATGQVYEEPTVGPIRPATTVVGLPVQDTMVGGLPRGHQGPGPATPATIGPGGPPRLGPAGQPLRPRGPGPR
jgi:hypothetical protein